MKNYGFKFLKPMGLGVPLGGLSKVSSFKILTTDQSDRNVNKFHLQMPALIKEGGIGGAEYLYHNIRNTDGMDI